MKQPQLVAGLSVRTIAAADSYPLILHHHYAGRIPSITYAYGLFEGDELVGVCTFGTPPSAPLRRGLLGPDMIDRVLELNRLVLLHNRPNEASFLVGAALRLLPTPRAVVSFADTEQAHVGTVYQATNFIYCGLSAKRTDWRVRGKEHLHGQTIADEFRGVEGRAAAMRAKYGDDFYLAPRPRKHRYVFFTGSKRERRAMLAALRYPQLPYPKEARK